MFVRVQNFDVMELFLWSIVEETIIDEELIQPAIKYLSAANGEDTTINRREGTTSNTIKKRLEATINLGLQKDEMNGWSN